MSNTDKIFKAPEEYINAVKYVGPETLQKMQRTLSPVQMKMIYERAILLDGVNKVRQRLKFWEAGIINNLRNFAIWVTIWAIGGYFGGPYLIELCKQITYINMRLWGAILVGSYGAMVFNLYDIGRLNWYWHMEYADEVRGEAEEIIIEHLEPAREDDPGAQWLSATEIKEQLGIDLEVSSLGKLLSDLGFIKKRTKKRRAFCVKFVGVT